MRGPIQAALDGHMALLTTLQVSWEGVPFEPTPGVIWYEPVLMGGGENILSTGGDSPYMEQRGIYQIKVSAPADTMVSGAGVINLKIDAVTQHFRAGQSFSKNGVRVTLLGCTVAPPTVTPRWYALPVSVSYMAHYFA